MNWNSESRFCVRAFVRATLYPCVEGVVFEVNGVTSKIVGLGSWKKGAICEGIRGILIWRWLVWKRRVERWISRIVEWVIINMYGEGVAVFKVFHFHFEKFASFGSVIKWRWYDPRLLFSSWKFLLFPSGLIWFKVWKNFLNFRFKNRSDIERIIRVSLMKDLLLERITC